MKISIKLIAVFALIVPFLTMVCAKSSYDEPKKEQIKVKIKLNENNRRPKRKEIFTVEPKKINSHNNYKAIFTFIKTSFITVKQDDAHLIARYLVNSSRKYQLDPKFVAALMARESAFNRKAISSTGAKGLGQIKDFNFKSLKIKDPFSIQQNCKGTVMYLKQMLKGWHQNPLVDKNQKEVERHKVKLALASYFKGINAVKRDKAILDQKSNKYAEDILNYYEEIKRYTKQRYRKKKNRQYQLEMKKQNNKNKQNRAVEKKQKASSAK